MHFVNVKKYNEERNWKKLEKSETLRLDKQLNKLELKENTFTGKLFSDSGVVTSLEIS